jgi:hypothetical protein
MEMEMNSITIIIALIILFAVYNFLLSNKSESFDEPRFPPKEFVMTKKPYKISECARHINELEGIQNSPVERNISEWSHRGHHDARHVGHAPKYHDQKTVQYLPSWPNAMDNFEVIKDMPRESLVFNEDYPIFEVSDKVDMDDMLY